MAFIFIGQVNVLAPIVTINFLLTYSFIDYSFFSVTMNLQLQAKEKRDTLALAKRNQRGSTRPSSRPLIDANPPSYGSGGESPQRKGTLLEFTKDMDQIFPPVLDVDAGSEKTTYNAELGSQHEGRKTNVTAKQKLMDSFGLDLNSNMFSEEKGEEAEVQCGATEPMAGEEPPLQCYSKMNHAEQDSSAGVGGKAEHQSFEIKPMQDSLHAKFCNHWAALIGVGNTSHALHYLFIF
ncbi:Solute carrier family 12 member 8 [Liparis tanakae]|uniref:Solute carrier family 12 member 8 n=1 Tax=Liparis tanakae TaxID=230148 RepID=A0A4Z2GGY9_9TELE|nr:Solute carrier family 12 member 8 [Liparis tanakae]